MLRVLESEFEEKTGDELPTLDALAREGARRMLSSALEEEVEACIVRHQAARDERGRRLVVRNGHAEPRKVTCGAGTIEVEAPRVNDKRVDENGERQRFASRILPPYMRRSPKVDEALPVLYLRGLSTGDFRPALAGLLGEDAAGLSATSITRLTAQWEAEYERFRQRSLEQRDYVYIWVDGIHVRVRLEEDRLCLLVVIGVRPDGTKELVAIEDGYRESTESWLAVLRGLKARGMRAPCLAVGDGALGFWSAVAEVWPETKEQRDWCHKLANVLDKLPKRLQAKAKAALHEVMYAASREQAEEAIEVFARDYADRHAKAVDCLRKDQERLLTFFDFPVEHWVHLRTSNVIESTFATVRLRQRVTKGPGSRIKGLTMAWKLLTMAEQRWRRLNGSHLLPVVREGAKFVDGVRVERQDYVEEVAA